MRATTVYYQIHHWTCSYDWLSGLSDIFFYICIGSITKVDISYDVVGDAGYPIFVLM